MRVALTQRFQSDVIARTDAERAAVMTVLLALPKALGRPHDHAGLGLRKIHSSGTWEARVGLGLRMVFALADSTLTLVRLGTHDDVKRFLKAL
jgi:mRNA-degrading endonuclease YafQ of YafQ-DinJ toxin-antitoxin module